MKLNILFGAHYMIFLWGSDYVPSIPWSNSIWTDIDNYGRNFVDYPKGVWVKEDPQYLSKYTKDDLYITSTQLHNIIDEKLIFKKL